MERWRLRESAAFWRLSRFTASPQNPDRVGAEVTYPVLLGQDSESELFKWFVANDRWEKKPLLALTPGKGLPALERYDPRRR